tara:strand:- start:3661 stop:4347 length:687 start_codon:yes stop_codon:yes gene_type:complete
MPTLAVNRKGFITGTSASDYSTALVQSTGTATDSATGNQTTCIQYFQSSGRGGGTFRFIRTFLHFNTTGISGASSISLQLTSVAGDASSGLHNVTAVKHTAGSSNGSAIVDNDFNNVDKSTAYSGATAYGSSGTITFNLNAAAATQINNNNDFNIALLLTADVAGEEESPLEEDGSINNGIAFNSAISLVYTAAATGYGNDINTVSSDSIAELNTVATANIGKVITVG